MAQTVKNLPAMQETCVRSLGGEDALEKGMAPLCVWGSRLGPSSVETTPETAAHQAPPSLGFSRQEHWSGLPFLSPMHESEKRK